MSAGEFECSCNVEICAMHYGVLVQSKQELRFVVSSLQQGAKGTEDRREAARELERLDALDTLQAAEIDMLTKEIYSLQHKGGVTQIPTLAYKPHSPTQQRRMSHQTLHEILDAM